MIFAFANVSVPPPRIIDVEVTPFVLDEIPEKGDDLTIIKAGHSIQIRVRRLLCTKCTKRPEDYPHVDRVILGEILDGSHIIK